MSLGHLKSINITVQPKKRLCQRGSDNFFWPKHIDYIYPVRGTGSYIIII